MAKKQEQKELTREEKIAKAYADFGRGGLNGFGYDAPVPDNRKLYPGDIVEIGNLENCTVVETSDDFKQVIVEYSRTENNYGRPFTTHGLIGGWAWFDVVPLPITEDQITRDRTVAARFINSDLRGMVSSAFRRGVKDNPDYQRGYVWSEQDEQNFLRSIIEDRDIGKFVFVHDASYSGDYHIEVLDGKQRLNTILKFVTSVISYDGKYFHQLSRRDRYRVESRHVQYAELDNNQYSKAELLQLFLDVNAGGVPQTEEHLDHVRQLLADELKKEK